jgi:hypothetical protein
LRTASLQPVRGLDARQDLVLTDVTEVELPPIAAVVLEAVLHGPAQLGGAARALRQRLRHHPARPPAEQHGTEIKDDAEVHVNEP